MNKGQVSIGIVTALSAVTVLFTGWNSWLSNKTISIGEQTAAVLEWQKYATDKLDKAETRMNSIDSDINQLKIDGGTTKELIKLIGERYQINSAAVEARVIQNNKEEDIRRASSTAIKI